MLNAKSMRFKDRRDAGKQLAAALDQYKGEDVVVYALPRGGVVIADEIASHLKAPLDLLFAHKIGHPYQPEYAIAAVSETGQMVGSAAELAHIDDQWVKDEKKRQLEEMKKRRTLYLKDANGISSKGKIAIIVDDGIATGLTMMAGVQEIKDYKPKKIVVAVPVASKHSADILRDMVDEFVALTVPSEDEFLGAVGAYFSHFDQVEDDEVIKILKKYKRS